MNKIINKEFINSLCLEYGKTVNFVYEDLENLKIVPNELTHDFLLKNFLIDENILTFYYLPTNSLLNESELEKIIRPSFVGNKKFIFHPYSINICGAFYSRFDLKYKLDTLKIGSERKKINGKEIKNFDDLKPYFTDYAKGFKNGFEEFDNTQIKPFLTMFPEKMDYVNKVFEYVTKNLFLQHSWVNFLTGFSTTLDYEILNGFENGQKQGYFYRAWSIIFSNNQLFCSLFEKHLAPSEPQLIIQENEIESQIEPFNPKIFKDQNSYDLFLFLVHEYATTKQPKQFSQIFHWMKENDNSIKPNTGVKYQKFVLERFPEMVAKFSRIDVRNRNEISTLNEIRKRFNSLNKV